MMLQQSKVVKHSQSPNLTPQDTLINGKVLMNRYQILEKIGRGTYGKVYKARDLVDDCFVAIKKINFYVGFECLGLSDLIFRTGARASQPLVLGR